MLTLFISGRTAPTHHQLFFWPCLKNRSLSQTSEESVLLMYLLFSPYDCQMHVCILYDDHRLDVVWIARMSYLRSANCRHQHDTASHYVSHIHQPFFLTSLSTDAHLSPVFAGKHFSTLSCSNTSLRATVPTKSIEFTMCHTVDSRCLFFGSRHFR